MNTSRGDFYGLSRIIYDAICKIKPEFAFTSHISDVYLLNDLEERLREILVKRQDGSSRLVIDLTLSKAMKEMRRQLVNPGRLFTPLGPDAASCLPMQTI
ncbi:MAG: hypothetical protein LBJ14_02625 [Desulfarculales bacterium]|jgi:hypothetical protein|nr:hypothetical protein [Desulfarculales bacterium]